MDSGIIISMQSALLDGVELLAWELTEEDFASVRDRYRADRECLKFRDGLRAIPRGGPLRRNHFSHRPGEGGSSEPETIHHIHAKRALRAAAQSRGWVATIEARHPDGHWQADVLAEKLGRRIAFEVQWSPQSALLFQERTERYRRDGVETVWIAKSTMRVFDSLPRELNVIPFDESGVGRHVRYPLVRAFETCFDLLESDARRSEAAPIHRHRCYKCRGAWFSTEIHLTWGEKRAFTDEELHVLGAWAGSLWFDHSHTREEGYLMWHCPHCQAKQGDFYLRPSRAEIVHGGTVIPDPRGMSLWNALEERLASAGIDPVERAADERPAAPSDPESRDEAAEKSPRQVDALPHALPIGAQLAHRNKTEPSSTGQARAQRTGIQQAEIDAINKEAEADTRSPDDPGRIQAFYARTLPAAKLHDPGQV